MSSIYFFFGILPSNNCDKLQSEEKIILETVFSRRKKQLAKSTRINKSPIQWKIFNFCRVLISSTDRCIFPRSSWSIFSEAQNSDKSVLRLAECQCNARYRRFFDGECRFLVCVYIHTHAYNTFAWRHAVRQRCMRVRRMDYGIPIHQNMNNKLLLLRTLCVHVYSVFTHTRTQLYAAYNAYTKAT